MKRITGTFFDIVHHSKGESRYWHDAVVNFRSEEWAGFMEHMRESGIDTVIHMAAVSRGKALFPSHPVLPAIEYWENFDPIEAALAGADLAGLDFYLGLGLQETYSHEIAHTPEAVKRTLLLAEALLARYSKHSSLTGWYIADEFGFNEKGAFNQEPVGYLAEVSQGLERLTPKMPRLISPYFHTNCVIPDPDKLTGQIEQMAVDAVAVQNGANLPFITEEFFVNIRRAFERTDTKFWGNVELFNFAFESQDHSAPLLPGNFERIRTQMSWIDPYVEKLISYQLMGLMNNMGLGKQPEAAELWHRYMKECMDPE
jgi:Domain of unknown function (DUF4434)